MAKAKVTPETENEDRAPSTDEESYDAPPTVMEFEEDVADAERPPILPKGKYPAQITAATPKRSKSSDNSYVDVTFLISADSYPVDFEGNEEGESLHYRRVTWGRTDAKARYNMKKWLAVIEGPTGKAVDCNDWIGCEAVVVVDHERSEQDGEMYPVITRVVAK